MKKLGFLNKVPTKCESSTPPEFDQVKAGKIGWTGHLGDAKRALSRKAKGFSFPLTSSSTPYLFSTAPPPPKRAPSTTLTLRSKSMTAELEELGEYERERLDSNPKLSSSCLVTFLLSLCQKVTSPGLFFSFSPSFFHQASARRRRGGKSHDSN